MGNVPEKSRSGQAIVFLVCTQRKSLDFPASVPGAGTVFGEEQNAGRKSSKRAASASKEPPPLRLVLLLPSLAKTEEKPVMEKEIVVSAQRRKNGRSKPSAHLAHG